MGMSRFFFISSFFLLFSCSSKPEDQTFAIYHLQPDSIRINTDTAGTYGWYAKIRKDFFVVKNFDKTNEQHKIKIDQFVIRYVEQDKFLVANKNVSWALTFFKYGDEITEDTVHQYDTDYTIHNLFSQKKEIGVYVFDSQIGYRESYYWESHKTSKFDDRKRKLIVDYFKP